ncbi:Calx-beta domain-containing protein [Parachryseolinea silvisoli]|uniref:Calx-beta domain-containing protein n=1 Tax=Parachryseolinea silvisoli TaxID=2873601 RepID=UPI0022659569|nr:Calx-beta domain-containing protein [Parachryseolinea silvisoli]MCD9019318.1 hypothetical protein [Parachryseolinea silvisoli]
MKKLYSKYISLLALAVAFAACSDDDKTGESILTPTSPTVNITIDHPEVTLLEKDSTFEFTVTLSTAQIVDVAVYVNVTGGDATEGSDFTYTSLLKIPANRTTAKGQVKILADEVPEDTETLTITVGDARTENASITPRTISFTIQNVSNGDLPLALSWAGVLFDGSGTEIAPTDIANLIFYITDPNGDRATVNGAAFEEALLTEDLDDGEYLLQVGIASAIDPGQLGELPKLDLTLEYSQLGVQNPGTLEFPAAFDPSFVCANNIYTLAKVVKSGSSYEVVRVGVSADKDLSAYAGDYDALEPGYGTYDVNFSAGSAPYILVNDNFWDSGVEIEYHSDVCAGVGEITIPSQNFVIGGTTYTVTGSGTYTEGEIIVDYVVKAGAATIDANTHTFTLKP